ncbi:MAG: hypothetical protein NW220_00545 [Leptolyngbyaceae cyanobacterium bins.349]|nr:hypothetical protein [Leptolyngbyaceae cyanobacterium bins.349]
MTRGLIWLPLLVFFVWLAWTGWREYQKVEAYQHWAAAFDRAKYDIYSVLGQTGDELTWGLPTRQGPVNLETCSLQTIESVQVQVKGQPIDFSNPPAKGRAELFLMGRDRATPIVIPFTEPPLAAQWGQHLQREIQRLQQKT